MLYIIVAITFTQWLLSRSFTSFLLCGVTNSHECGLKEMNRRSKQLTIIYQEESIYNCNEGQMSIWEEKERPALLLKTKGSGVVASDPVEEHVFSAPPATSTGEQKLSVPAFPN